jgi:hypothetical protein
MLSASSGVRISSKSEKSEIDKSSIVVFKPRDMVDESSVDSAAVMDTFSNGDDTSVQCCFNGSTVRCAG